MLGCYMLGIEEENQNRHQNWLRALGVRLRLVAVVVRALVELGSLDVVTECFFEYG